MLRIGKAVADDARDVRRLDNGQSEAGNVMLLHEFGNHRVDGMPEVGDFDIASDCGANGGGLHNQLSLQAARAAPPPWQAVFKTIRCQQMPWGRS